MAKHANLSLCITFPLLAPLSFYHPHPTKCQLGNSTTISAPIISSLCSSTCQFSPLSLVQSLSHSSQRLFQTFHYRPKALYSTLLASPGRELCFLLHWDNWGHQDRSHQLPLPPPPVHTISSPFTPILPFLSLSFRMWVPRFLFKANSFS